MEVPALSLEDVTELLEAVLGGRLQSTTARRLFAATAGNVLWLRHLVDGERASGRLRCTDHTWHWWGEPQLSSALAALIDARIGGLPPGVRGVLELLALAEPLGVDLLQSLVGEAELENSADRKLVTVNLDGDQWVARLAHPLYGEAVRGRLSPVRARRLRGRLVESLTVGSKLVDGLKLAVLALDSDLPPDPEMFLAAANRASLLTDFELTERLVVAARAGGAGFDAQLLLGFTLTFVFRAEEAELEYAKAAALASSDAQRLRVAQARAVNLSLIVGRPDEGNAVLTAADNCAGAGVELLGLRSLFAMAADRLEEAVAGARRGLNTSGVSGPCECYSAWALVSASALSGWRDQSSAVAARGARAALRAPETISVRMNLAWWEVLGLGLAGRVDQMRQLIGQLAASMSGRFATFLQPDFEGWLALVTGRVATATTLLGEFRPYFAGHGGGWTSLLELRFAMALGMAGDAVGARTALERAQAARHPAITVIEPQFPLARAWLSAAESATTNAIQQARRAGTLAARSGQFAVEVIARHAAVSFGDRGQAARLTELARHVDSPRALVAAAHAAAWADHNQSALLAAADRFAVAGLMLSAAEAAAQAETLARRRLDPAATTIAAGRTAELVAACEGARTPALLAAARPLPISDRQREVAGMVAAQLSNREIADRLGVSIRTVEGHIYQACVKLGVPNRTSLAALLRRSS